MKHDDKHESVQNEALELVIGALLAIAADLGKSALVAVDLQKALDILRADDAS